MLKQEQPDGCSVRPVAHVNRATLNSGRHRVTLDLDPGSIVGAIKRFRGYHRGTKFRMVHTIRRWNILAKFWGPQRRIGSSRLTLVDGGDRQLFRACDARTLSFRIPGVGAGGLVPRPDQCRFRWTLFHLFQFPMFLRTPATSMRVDDISTPTEIPFLRRRILLAREFSFRPCR